MKLTSLRSQGTVEEKAIVNLTAGKPVKIYVEYTNTALPAGNKKDISNPAVLHVVVGLPLSITRPCCQIDGFLQRLGGCPAINPDAAIEEAVQLAKDSDVAVLVVGLSSDWDAEGSDRPSLDLPCRQHELIQKVVVTCYEA